MTENAANYKLLFAGILAFFVIMTYDHQLLMSGDTTEIVKLIAGIPAVIYLLFFNVKKKRKKGSE